MGLAESRPLSGVPSKEYRCDSEWINPKTGEGGGSYPFRTGICTVMMAIDHIVSALEENSAVKA
jgi:hypothetical protein